MKWYLKALRQYADFGGRARRTEFWMFLLVSNLISLGLRLVDATLGLHVGGFAVLATGYFLAVLTPSVAVMVRRMHDTGNPGWRLLPIASAYGACTLVAFLAARMESAARGTVAIVALLAAMIVLIWFIVSMAIPGEPHQNKWGTNPKNPTQTTYTRPPSA